MVGLSGNATSQSRAARPEGDRISQLWLWDGQRDGSVKRLSLPGIINMNNGESIDSVMVDDQPMLLLMSDEGDPDDNRQAQYLMLGYDMIGD